jgi:DNA-binding transcriptional LysR family regulator
MARLAATHPDIDLEIVEHVACDPLEEQVAGGTVDVAFTILPLDDPRLQTRSLMLDEHLFVVPADDPLADRIPTLEVLGTVPMICYRDCRGQSQVEERMSAAGVPLRVTRRADGNGIMHGLIAAGAGVALLPRLAFDPLDSRVTGIELDGLVPPREIGLVWQRKRHLGPAVRAVIEAAGTVCGRLTTPVG